MNKLVTLNFLILSSFLLLVSCVPKDEFLPREVQQIGATGLREKKIEEEKLRKIKEEQERLARENTEVNIDEPPVYIPPNVNDIFSTFTKKISFDDSVMTGGNQLRKWYVDGHRKTDEELLEPTNVKKLYFYFYGEFLTGDQLYIYPDSGCSNAIDRTRWTSPTVFEIGQNDFEKYLLLEDEQNSSLPIPGLSSVGVNIEIDGSMLEDGIFYPTVRFKRNGILSSCYSFINSSNKMQKDTLSPTKPILQILNPIGVNGRAQLEIEGYQSDLKNIIIYKNPSCDESSEKKIINNINSPVSRFNYLLEEADFEEASDGEVVDFNFSAKYKDKAGNYSSCSNFVSYSQMKPPSTMRIKEIENMLVKSDLGIYFSSEIEIEIELISEGINPTDKITFFNNGDCSPSGRIQEVLESETITYTLNDREIEIARRGQPILFSVELLHNERRSCILEPLEIFYTELGPKVWLEEIDNVQYFPDDDIDKDSPQKYRTFEGKVNQGIKLDIMNWVKLKNVKFYADKECFVEVDNNDFRVEGFDDVGEPYNYNLKIIPILSDEAIFHDLYFKVIDDIGNDSNCIEIEEAIFRE